MKKGYVIVLVFAMLCGVVIGSSPLLAKGGAGPCLASCCLGPRIGLEMNEGVKIELVEFLQLVPAVNGAIRLWIAYDYGYKNAGMSGCLASYCIGPRVGKEFNERKIRTMEYLRLIPIINLYPYIVTGMEAMGGRTMTEIEEEENLAR